MKTKPFFMVYVEGQNSPTYIHDTFNSANIEAERLAKRLNRKAYVLCTIKSFELNPLLKVEYCLPDIDNEP